MAALYLDGRLVRTSDEYSPESIFGVRHGFGSLTDGVHTLRVVALGVGPRASRGTAVWVDAFRVA